MQRLETVYVWTEETQSGQDQITNSSVHAGPKILIEFIGFGFRIHCIRIQNSVYSDTEFSVLGWASLCHVFNLGNA